MFKRNIPNAITCGNLLCGCLAIVKCFEGDLIWAAYLVGIAAILDFFDGFAARLLKVSSVIGKDLDSLADMVTFGVVPGIIMYHLINISILCSNIHDPWEDYKGNFVLSYLGFFIPIFSAIRLAKFNNDTRQAESFIGLPTPANAILICSLPLILYKFNFPGVTGLYISPFNVDMLALDSFHGNTIVSMIIDMRFLFTMIILLSYLLIAEIPLFSLKFKNFNWKGNEIRLIFLVWSIVLLASLQFIGVPLVIFSYIIFSLINNWFLKPKIHQ